MKNDRDHALVVGISRYPGISDLRAPVRDAEAVREWLIDPNGGGLPRRNAKLKVSPKAGTIPAPPNARPSDGDVRGVLDTLVYRAAKANSRDEEGYFGRRLYIYMAGHGMSKELINGCLLTANATRDIGNHVAATPWLDCLVKRQMFREYVMWLDFCLDEDVAFSVLPSPCYDVQRTGAPTPAIHVTFACAPTKRTVERKIRQDGNRLHGVFTWTLLQGLRGAARMDSSAPMTADDLLNYIRNSMKDHLTEEDKNNSLIGATPYATLRDEIELVPAPPPAARRRRASRKYRVTFNLPAAAKGKQGLIWSQASAPLSQPLTIRGAKAGTRPPAGLHLIEVPDLRLRQGFEVTGSGPVSVTVDQQGEPVRPPEPGSTFRMRVAPSGETTEIVVIDSSFQLRASVIGSLWQSQVPSGIYKVQAKVSSALNEVVVLVDRDDPDIDLVAPAVASAAPLPNSACAHEYHEDLIHGLESRSADVTAGAGAQIFLMARAWAAPGEREAKPWVGVQLVDDRSRVLADLSRDGERRPDGDPVAACLVDVDPGVYYLRESQPDGREIQQALIASAGWRLEAYLLRSHADTGRPRRTVASSREVSLLMVRTDAARDFELELQLEAASQALADGRWILDDRLKRALLRDFDNPLAGLLGAHLLLLEVDDPAYTRPRRRRRRPGLTVLNGVVKKLRGMLGGRHPDVEILSLRCPNDDLRTAEPLSAPPMFARSWQIALEADARSEEGFVPRAVDRRIGSARTDAPYFAWRSDEAALENRDEQRRSAIGSLAPEAEPPPRRRVTAPRTARRRAVAAPPAGLGRLPPPPARRRAAGAAPRVRLGAAGAYLDADELEPEAEPPLEARLQAAQMQIPASVLRELWTS